MRRALRDRRICKQKQCVLVPYSQRYQASVAKTAFRTASQGPCTMTYNLKSFPKSWRPKIGVELEQFGCKIFNLRESSHGYSEITSPVTGSSSVHRITPLCSPISIFIDAHASAG